MKILTTLDGTVKYKFKDDEIITYEVDRIKCPNFHIGDLREADVILVTGISNLPVDFKGDQYSFDGSNFTITDRHPDFVVEEEV